MGLMINPVSRTRRVCDYTDRRVPAGTYDEQIKKKKVLRKGQPAPEGILLGEYFRLRSRRWTFNKAAGVSAGARPWVHPDPSQADRSRRLCLASPAFIEIHRTVL